MLHVASSSTVVPFITPSLSVVLVRVNTCPFRHSYTLVLVDKHQLLIQKPEFTCVSARRVCVVLRKGFLLVLVVLLMFINSSSVMFSVRSMAPSLQLYSKFQYTHNTLVCEMQCIHVLHCHCLLYCIHILSLSHTQPTLVN